tara:strand:- start:2148 stop:2315 length:168 start_codon:yes stop_codon:yes gene_type:complete
LYPPPKVADTDRNRVGGTTPTVDEIGIKKHPRIVYNIYIIINIYNLSLKERDINI